MPCVKQIALNVDPLGLQYEHDKAWDISHLGLKWAVPDDFDGEAIGPDWQNVYNASAQKVEVPDRIKLSNGTRHEILEEHRSHHQPESMCWLLPDFQGTVIDVDVKALSAADIQMIHAQRARASQQEEGGGGLFSFDGGLGGLFSSAMDSATSYLEETLDNFEEMAAKGFADLEGRQAQQREDLDRANASLDMAEDRLANAMRQLELAEKDLDESDVGFCTELWRSMKDAFTNLFPEDDEKKPVLVKPSKVEPVSDDK